MSKHGPVVLGCLVLGLVAIAGCGDDAGGGDEGAGNGANECFQGTSYSCSAPAGCARGIQLCRADGTLSACTCADGAGGTGGGSAGTGGSMLDGGDVTADASHGGDGDGDGDDTPDASTGDGDGDGDGDSTPIEDCDNGEDDDDDGDIDCADSDCGALRCVESAPDGWSGPLALHVGSGSAPSCDGAFGTLVIDGGDDLVADPASCSTCTCAANAACASSLRVETSSEAECGGTPCGSTLTESCAPVATSCLQNVSTASLKTQLPNGLASCAPSNQTATITAAAFGQRAIGCELDASAGAGCDSGETCAPAVPSGFAQTLCIARSGQVSCPAGSPYTERTVYFTDFDDTRSCSACDCDHDCSYTWTIYAANDTSCAMPAVLSTSTPGQCFEVNPIGDLVRVGVDLSGTGSCTPAGGEPSGSASMTGPYTVCCEAP